MPGMMPAPPLERGPAAWEAARAVRQRDLLVQRHLFHDHIGPLVGRKVFVHPRTNAFAPAGALRHNGRKKASQ